MGDETFELIEPERYEERLAGTATGIFAGGEE